MVELMGVFPTAIVMVALGLLGDPEERDLPPGRVVYESEETVFRRTPLRKFLNELAEVPEVRQPAEDRKDM